MGATKLVYTDHADRTRAQAQAELKAARLRCLRMVRGLVKSFDPVKDSEHRDAIARYKRALTMFNGGKYNWSTDLLRS